MIYFDAAATTLEKPPHVRRAVLRAMACCASPGRGGHVAASAADDTLYRCRRLAGAFFDADPEQVVFTMNATHGLNIAIRSLIKPGDHVVLSGYEHNAVMRPLRDLGAVISGINAPLFDQERFLERLEEHLAQPCTAVILTHVSNVFGWRFPVEEAAYLCRRSGVPLILDAAQSAGVLPVSLRKTGAAFIAMPGHKGLYGPQGTGILLCAAPGRPLIYGGTGSQSKSMQMPDELPDRHEAGTPNVPGIAGLAAGLEFVRSVGTERICTHEQVLCRRAVEILRRHRQLHCYSSVYPDRQTGVLSVRYDGDCEWLAEQLADAGICTRAGLHCAPRAHQTAGTLACGTLRFSFSWFNQFTQLLQLAQVLDRLMRQ